MPMAFRSSSVCSKLWRSVASEQIDMAREVYPKFTNDHGVPEIRIGVKAFKCIGASPPQDHPHIYLEIGGEDTSILCPYCATRFRFDRGLDPFVATPPDSFFDLGDEAERA